MIDVAIVIPVLNKLEFTRQCLDRLWRYSEGIGVEVVVVDNGSADGTQEWFSHERTFPAPLRYHRSEANLGFARANNIGASLSSSRLLLFLNNDTLVQPGWLREMLRVRQSDPGVGIVGIKQLFPYTNVVYHTGIVFAEDGRPQHLYPHLDASLVRVNVEREYQAVTGACLLIDRDLFMDCGGFDEGYVNGYEDVDLCFAARQRKRKVICCTSAYIYHYGQISEGRTQHDVENAERFKKKWGSSIRPDQTEYALKDRAAGQPEAKRAAPTRSLATDCVYLADDLSHSSSFTWVNVELAMALSALGAPVAVKEGGTYPAMPGAMRRRIARLMRPGTPNGGIQIKWSHFWPRHLNLELHGDFNFELFAINYRFGQTHAEPWDRWMQCAGRNGLAKLPLSEFCRSVLEQVGVPASASYVLHPGFSEEARQIEPSRRQDSRFRFLTVTNSHDLGRYGTLAAIEAFDRTFSQGDAVVLVVKDYGVGARDSSIRRRLAERRHGAPIEYVADFTDKSELIRLYKSCDAFVSAHRGEGFGMKILDAMACGLPVITPLFGGPTAYCSSENCFPVEFSLVPVGQSIDSDSLQLTNQPLWADVDVASLAAQMRRVYEQVDECRMVASRAQASVVADFSWEHTAKRLVEIAGEARMRRSRPAPVQPHLASQSAERSPYWLGLRVSVVIPTFNRKDKLLACLDALGHQSILPQEFEVVVVDDGSTDGSTEAVASLSFPFSLRIFRQENQGPGAARNLGIDKAHGEIVLLMGDDVIADERLLEEHLTAHASMAGPGSAVLGHLDWPSGMRRNAVMDYVCGDAGLQFAYTLIPRLPKLDHRFFYTSNISLKRQFLTDAADAGIRFDPAFRHAAFEDSEFALRLGPRGLDIRYVPEARATHDHWLDLESFASREYRAGKMAVTFYRMHPGQEPYLKVQWIEGLNESAAQLSKRPDLLQQLEAFDQQTDRLLRALAGSLEALLEVRADQSGDLPTTAAVGVRPALDNVLRIVFDVERTRGKTAEWFAGVQDRIRIEAARTIATVTRKIEFFNLEGAGIALDGLGTLSSSLGEPAISHRRAPLLSRVFRSLLLKRALLARILAADRSLQTRLRRPGNEAWLARYLRVRARLGKGLQSVVSTS